MYTWTVWTKSSLPVIATVLLSTSISVNRWYFAGISGEYVMIKCSKVTKTVPAHKKRILHHAKRQITQLFMYISILCFGIWNKLWIGKRKNQLVELTKFTSHVCFKSLAAVRCNKRQCYLTRRWCYFIKHFRWIIWLIHIYAFLLISNYIWLVLFEDLTFDGANGRTHTHHGWPIFVEGQYSRQNT